MRCCNKLLALSFRRTEGSSSFALLDFERKQGYALRCSAYPLSDVTIELWDYEEEELLAAVPIQENQAEVERITVLTHDIHGIHLRLCGPTPMIDAALALFTPGGVPEHDIFYDKFAAKADTGG